MPEKKNPPVDQQETAPPKEGQESQDKLEVSTGSRPTSTPPLTRPQQESLRRKLKGKYH